MRGLLKDNLPRCSRDKSFISRGKTPVADHRVSGPTGWAWGDRRDW